MRLANGFQVSLNVAQIGNTRLEFVQRLVSIDLDLGLVGFTLGPLQKPQLVLLERDIGLQRVVTGGNFGLLFELVEVGIQLAQDVFDTGQVFAGVRQAVFRLAAAFLVFGHTRRLFEEQAQLFGLGLDDAADGALANDGVGPWAEARAQKHVLYVAAAHRLVVDVITAVAVAGQHPAHRNFRVLAPLATRAVVGVVKHQLHAGAAGGFAGRRAVKDHVLHRLAAQLGRLAFAQHPAHSVHDVGLAAAVGPHHPHQLPGQQEVGGFGKGLEPG